MSESIRVRYWAAARTAAGVAEETIDVTGPTSLADLCATAADRHRGTRLPDVLRICSVLVGEQPVSSADPAAVVIEPGATVEFLPPFAGG